MCQTLTSGQTRLVGLTEQKGDKDTEVQEAESCTALQERGRALHCMQMGMDLDRLKGTGGRMSGSRQSWQSPSLHMDRRGQRWIQEGR